MTEEQSVVLETALSTAFVEGSLEVIESFRDPSGAIWQPGDEKSPGFFYPEITGTYLKHCAIASMVLGEPQYLDRAEESAEWLLRCASAPDGWFKVRDYGRNDTGQIWAFSTENVASFDNAIILGGLAALCHHRPSSSLGDSITRLAANLEGVVGTEGSVPAILSPDRQPVKVDNPRWSTWPGPHLAKVAEALTHVWRIWPDGKHLRSARRICEYALSLQGDDGRFFTDPTRDVTQLHPHMYTCEGLYNASVVLGDGRFVSAAVRGVEWALRHCDPLGRIPQEIGPGGPVRQAYRTDALAQVLLLGTRMVRQGLLPMTYSDALDRLGVYILALRTPDGLFRYGQYEDGEEARSPCWVQIFALHALIAWYDDTWDSAPLPRIP